MSKTKNDWLKLRKDGVKTKGTLRMKGVIFLGLGLCCLKKAVEYYESFVMVDTCIFIGDETYK